jgi:hypothetical protein
VSSDEARQVAARAATELVVRPVVEVLAAVEQWSAGVGLPLRMLATGYGILALICGVALWRLMAEPARAKGHINVVR